MAKILMLVSSAQVIRLADGTPQPPGYFVEERRALHLAGALRTRRRRPVK